MKNLLMALFVLSFCGCAAKMGGPVPAQTLNTGILSDLQKLEAASDAKDVPVNGGANLKTFGDSIARITYYAPSKKSPVMRINYWNFDASTGALALKSESYTLTDGTAVISDTATAKDKSALTATLACSAPDNCKTASIKISKPDGKLVGDTQVAITQSNPTSVTPKENTSSVSKTDDSLDILNSLKFDGMKNTLQTISITGTATVLYRLKVQFNYTAGASSDETAFQEKSLFLDTKAGTAQKILIGFAVDGLAANAGNPSGYSKTSSFTGSIVEDTNLKTVQISIDGDRRLGAMTIQK